MKGTRTTTTRIAIATVAESIGKVWGWLAPAPIVCVAVVWLCGVMPLSGNAVADSGDDSLTGHGNNPPAFEWVGVSVGGIDFAMPPDLLAYLQAFGWEIGVANDCGELAITVCGEGRVCCLCVWDNQCSFSCQDATGDCEPCPHCGPDSE